MIERTVHIGLHKNLLIKAILNAGTTDGILIDWEGSVDEAIDGLRNAKLEYFTAPECDRRGEDGRCLGHDHDISR